MKDQGKTVLVKQIRSGAGRDKSVKATLAALGLGRIGKERRYRASPGLKGMLLKVGHLVDVREAAEQGAE